MTHAGDSPSIRPWQELLRNRTAIAIAGTVAAFAIALVMLTLKGPARPTFSPSPDTDTLAGDQLIGPRVFTVDSRDSERWRFFSFSTGNLVTDPGPLGWDLAFRRFQIIVNGGDDFAGEGGAVQLGDVSFDTIAQLPPEGYTGTEAARGDSISPPLEDWYRYSWVSHLLSPDEFIYGFRTADGRYGKLRFLSYYCPGARPGCVTFEYVYQGDGTRELIPSG